MLFQGGTIVYGGQVWTVSKVGATWQQTLRSLAPLEPDRTDLRPSGISGLGDVILGMAPDGLNRFLPCLWKMPLDPQATSWEVSLLKESIPAHRQYGLWPIAISPDGAITTRGTHQDRQYIVQLRPLGDYDGDGLPDDWEIEEGSDPALADSDQDEDADTLTLLGEYHAGTDPQDPDKDSDGLPDGWEVKHGYEPLDPADAAWDLDHDRLTTLQEYQAQTDPTTRYHLIDLGDIADPEFPWAGSQPLLLRRIGNDEPLTIGAYATYAPWEDWNVTRAYRLRLTHTTLTETLLLPATTDSADSSFSMAVNSIGGVVGYFERNGGSYLSWPFHLPGSASSAAALVTGLPGQNPAHWPAGWSYGISEPLPDAAQGLVVGLRRHVNASPASPSLGYRWNPQTGALQEVTPASYPRGLSYFSDISISPSGLVYGNFQDSFYDWHGFTWDGTQYRYLTLPSDNPQNPPTALSITKVNALGDILGRRYDLSYSEPGERTFLWKNGQPAPTYLQTSGFGHLTVEGLNDRGQVVGSFVTRSGQNHGYLWEQQATENGLAQVFTDLNNWLPANSPWEILSGREINSRGDILAFAANYAVTPVLLKNILLRPVSLDSDGDGMADDWENLHGLDPNAPDGSGDSDNDGMNNLDEFNAGTNASNSDSDGDGTSDGEENGPAGGTRDTDGDGVPDARDTDSDGDATGDAEDLYPRDNRRSFNPPVVQFAKLDMARVIAPEAPLPYLEAIDDDNQMSVTWSTSTHQFVKTWQNGQVKNAGSFKIKGVGSLPPTNPGDPPSSLDVSLLSNHCSPAGMVVGFKGYETEPGYFASESLFTWAPGQSVSYDVTGLGWLNYAEARGITDTGVFWGDEMPAQGATEEIWEGDWNVNGVNYPTTRSHVDENGTVTGITYIRVPFDPMFGGGNIVMGKGWPTAAEIPDHGSALQSWMVWYNGGLQRLFSTQANSAVDQNSISAVHDVNGAPWILGRSYTLFSGNFLKIGATIHRFDDLIEPAYRKQVRVELSFAPSSYPYWGSSTHINSKGDILSGGWILQDDDSWKYYQAIIYKNMTPGATPTYRPFLVESPFDGFRYNVVQSGRGFNDDWNIISAEYPIYPYRRENCLFVPLEVQAYEYQLDSETQPTDELLPKQGSIDSLAGIWDDRSITIKVILPEGFKDNPPPNFVTWQVEDQSGTIPVNSLEHTFTWPTSGIKKVTINFPMAKLKKYVHVDVPNVGTTSELEAKAYFLATGRWFAGAEFLSYSEMARNWAASQTHLREAQQNALKHAYWMGLCASSIGIGPADAIYYGRAHEHTNRTSGYPAYDSTMDLHNNEVGATVIYTEPYLGFPIENAVKQDVLNKLTNGELWVWDGPRKSKEGNRLILKSNYKKIYVSEETNQ